ncbi:MAG TPA: AmmeMemoRadiSam system protein B [Gammaproteobacteria bacterium]|nr:AmmeMemoRadiSam system protein B [Gammaproteobacteria bacterium]
MSEHVRAAAVAGLFYPGKRGELLSSVEALLADHAAGSHAPKAVIVPHAGYVYSGETAARAFARIAPVADQIERVVILGPSHRVPFHGVAAHTADAFLTPLGSVTVDRAAVDDLLSLPQVVTLNIAHEHEHSLEVELPFLQRLLGSFRVVPLVVGDASSEEVANVLDRVWGGPETLIVISTDLSHYLDYDRARQRDRRTADHILALNADAIGHGDACGCNPLRGMLALARRRRMRIEMLGLCNSGDTAGTRDRVVGYGAFALHERP